MTFTLILAFLVQIFFPIALAIWITRRCKVSWKLVAVGALTFIGSQVLHIPVVQGLTAAFASGALPAPAPGTALLFNAVLLGLLAGVFEESFRAIGYAVLRRAREWRHGLAFGAGHGGVESLFIGLATLANLVIFSMLRANPHSLNFPGVEGLLAQSVAFLASPWHLPLAGALERILAITLHLSLSVLVLQAFSRRNILWFFGAVLWHALVDGALVAASGLGWGVWSIEGLLVIFGLISLLIILALREKSAPAPRVEEQSAAIE